MFQNVLWVNGMAWMSVRFPGFVTLLLHLCLRIKLSLHCATVITRSRDENAIPKIEMHLGKTAFK